MLELRDVSFLVPGKPQEVVLLGDVNATLAPGQFVAVVGPSGCGKSTLLKLIAGICEPTFGELCWNGRNLETEGDLEPHEIGYVPQFSIAYERLSVEENLRTALRLRVAGLSAADREARCAAILEGVGLSAIAERPVEVLSGGQRRRLALALEMVTEPALLLCDEVTSGLDPKAEDELVELLGALARGGSRIVVSVTHSLRHLSAYDTIIVLHGGQLAYHGPPEHLEHYFQIDEPAELYPRLSVRKPEEWHRSWKKHRHAFAPAPALAQAGSPAWSDPEAPHPSPAKPEEAEVPEPPQEPAPAPGVPGFGSQFATLLGRRWKLFFRDASGFWLQAALVLGFPCLVVIFALDGLPQIQNLSLGLSGDVIKHIQEDAAFAAQASRAGSLVSGLVMFQVILLTLMGSNNGAREIAGERLIFEKEKFGGVRPGAYVASKAVFLFTLVAVQSLWMALFVKTVCGFPGELGPQALMLLAVNAAMTALCLGISSLARSAEQASLISIYLVGFQLPLSGAVLALPEGLGWLTRPFIAAYWGWSGYLQTLVDTRLYDVVRAISQTVISPGLLCLWVLAAHVILGLFLAYAGCRNSRWPR